MQIQCLTKYGMTIFMVIVLLIGNSSVLSLASELKSNQTGYFAFSLKNKNILVGSDLKKIKANFPNLKKSVLPNTYESALGGDISASFKFTKNKLVQVSVSNDIELNNNNNELQNLIKWVKLKYGEGVAIKKTSEGEELLRWNIGNIEITKESFFGADGAGMVTYLKFTQR